MENTESLLLSYIPITLQQELQERAGPLDGPEQRTYLAAVLFADISGFTTLTEHLMHHSEHGVEEITLLLNRYFHAMNTQIAAEGGDVIQFTGDGITALFIAHDEAFERVIRRTQQAAAAMFKALGELTDYATSIGTIALQMKIGIAAGEIQTIKAGGEGGVWHWVVTGEPFQQLAELELDIGTWRFSPEAEERVLKRPVPQRPLVRPPLAPQPSIQAQIRGFVSLLIQRWMRQGMNQWLATRRRMSVVMIKVWEQYAGQMDLATLNTLTISTQQLMDRHRGLLRQIAIDEKGTALVCLFGAPPYTGDDDATRAVQFALEAVDEALRGDYEVSIGIATGLVFSGPIGDDHHREYTVIGDIVNLAARLMGHAEPSQILCDTTTYRAINSMAWEMMPPVRLKGKSGFIRLFQPHQGPPSSGVRAIDLTNPLIERQEQLDSLEALFVALEKGEPQMVLIEGEAGTGKSRLLEATTQIVRRHGIVGLLGFGSALERNTAYSGWIGILNSYFSLGSITAAEDRRERIHQLVAELAPEHLERLPLLNDALNLGFEETDLTKNLDSTLRPYNLALLLATLFRHWLDEQPLVLAFEDIHWLDSLSWELMIQVGRLLWRDGGPFCLMLLTRPLPDASPGALALLQLQGFAKDTFLQVGDLNQQSTATLMAIYLGVLRRSLPPALIELVYQRTNGNPALINAMMVALREQDIVRLEPDSHYPDVLGCLLTRSVAELPSILPVSAQGMLLSRVDHLPPEQQLILKAASAIGRVFRNTLLVAILNETNALNPTSIPRQLQALVEQGIIISVAENNEPAYRFKQGLMQEALYANMLYSQRQVWHLAIIQWYEANYPTLEERQPFATLLAQHSHLADDHTREQVYALQAAHLAMERYAAAEAIAYLTRAIDLLTEDDPASRYAILLRREQMYDHMGARSNQRADLEQLEALQDPTTTITQRLRLALRWANFADITDDYAQMERQANLALDLAYQSQQPIDAAAAQLMLGRLFWKRGVYANARHHLQAALAHIDGVHDHGLKGDILRNLGIVQAYSGHFAEAQTTTELALQTYRQGGRNRGVATALNNLGRFAMMQGNYDQAEQLCQQALAIDTSFGLRGSQAITLANLAIIAFERGIFRHAYELTQSSLLLSREVGNRYIEAIALDNLGDIARSVGDFSTSLISYRQALRICTETDNRRMESEIRSGMALLALWKGDHELAYSEAEHAQRLAKNLGAPRETALALTSLAYVVAATKDTIAFWKQSHTLWEQIGDPWHTLEAHIGWAAALIHTDLSTAQAIVTQRLPMLLQGVIHGVSDAIQVFMTAAAILEASDDPRASTVLDQGLKILQERAQLLEDSALINGFFEGIPSHRNLLELTARMVIPMAKKGPNGGK